MWWLAAVADAHEPGLSRLEVGADDLTWSVASADGVDPAWLGSASVSRGGGRCAVGPASSTPSEGDGLEIRVSLSCPEGGALVVEAGFLANLPPGHRTVVEVAGAPVAWLDVGHPAVTVGDDALAGAAGPSATEVAREYVGLGVEHILTGWDHLLFLTGLLLGVRSLREAAAVVTGFTVAHSITLALAALGWVVLSPALVEPAIALTVVWVGVENLLPSAPRRRVALTSLLGLVHGLGFAGLLAELGLPRGQLLPALVSFNVGVELGQFAVVLVALPLLGRLRDLPRSDRALRGASVAVSLVGLGWFVQRVAAG